MACDFDIIIVGGGIAGSALAAALADVSLKVAVIEAGPLLQQQPHCGADVFGFDARVSALTPLSQQFLSELGAWSRIAQLRASPYRHMHVWDADGTGAIDFDAADLGRSHLGHIVENRVTVWALQQSLRHCANVVTLEGRRVTELSPLAEGEVSSGTPLYRLQLDDGSQLSAGLVVAADGALSSIRRLADVTTREWDYEHVATVATIETESSHQQTAWQRFMPEGPLAFLPLANGTDGGHFCSIVWSAQPDLAERIAVMDDAQFCAQLGRAFEYRLGEVLRASPRRSFPLRQRHATCYYKTGLALVGDAAHTIHPLAGQGINLGLKDVAVLAQELKRAVDLGLAPGLPAILGRFQRRRQADNLATMVVMDGFKRLFGERSLGIRWLRNSGMNQLNRAPLLKRRIMRQAMGL